MATADEMEVTSEICSDLEYSNDQCGENNYINPITHVRYTDNKVDKFEVLHNGKIYELAAKYVRDATPQELLYYLGEEEDNG